MAVRRVNTDKKVENLWNCPYCGTTKILGRHKSCPKCGRSRMGGTYVGDNPEERILSEEDKALFTGKADWYCDYCGSMNPSNVKTCVNCGSPKGESKKDYFDRKREQVESGELPKEDNVILPSETNDEEDNSYPQDTNSSDSYFGNYYSSSNDYYSTLSENKKNKRLNFSSINLNNILLGLAIFIACGLSIFGIVYACMPKTDTITVQGISWERNIETEVEKTFSESDWTLPANARLLYTNEEWHHDDKVIDHYEDVEVTKYSYEVVGERTWTEYQDNGDSTSDVIQCSEDVYDYVPYQTTESQPVYKNVPVYQTKYYYEIDRYVHNRNLRTSGTDKDVYWSDEPLYFDEREGIRTQTYSITALNENEELKTYTLDYSIWKDVEIGDTFKVKVHLGNRIEILDDEGNVINNLVSSCEV